MLELYPQSAVLTYSSHCATTLHGSIISFFELSEKPMIYSVISKDRFSVYLINPAFSFQSFIEEIPYLLANVEEPLFLFNYDFRCFEKYQIDYAVNFKEFLMNLNIKPIQSDRFTDLEDFYSFTLPEHYLSFFNLFMYQEFAKTKEIYEIISFVRSIMFSKLVLIIDSFSTFNLLPKMNKEITPAFRGFAPTYLPEKACLIDIETFGIEKSSSIQLFTIYKENYFFSYFLNEFSELGQNLFREFILKTISFFDIVYVFNSNFEKIFFPEFDKFVDIRFKKYQYWASARKLVHLPYFHLTFDPGSGKNVPIWLKLYQIECDVKWQNLVFQRTITNLLTKLAILSSNDVNVPFKDPIVADTRKLLPTKEFLNQLNGSNHYLKKKICYLPIEYFNTYNPEYSTISEMFLEPVKQLEELE